MLLSVSNLTKYYGKKVGVENISFTLSEKEILGFVGPNGAGKSTTIRCIMGLLRPNKGSITMFNQKLDKSNFQNLVKMVGYVPGEVSYYDDVRVEDILKFYKSFYENFDDNYCEELCKRFDLPLKKKFEELSTGNKKKVAIVQAIAHKPRLIIMDEPTNGLDPFIQKMLYKTLIELKESGVGILFSSHILSEVQHLCDRVIFIKEGHMVEPKDFRRDLKKIVLTVNENSAGLEKIIERYPEVTDLIIENSTVTLYFKWNSVNFKKLINELEFENITIEAKDTLVSSDMSRS
ncbi:ABC-2 type transport system ATP-binding protein [Fervidobacterium changbaicum]|uniref:ABC transporter ATP-binding protein n=2 Tax=Fervidobacterium TaxID=2422 RepID=A0AAI8CKT2_FERIS|nr:MULTISPECIES: ABC transporter ATP-binding protein [Fervidobacterium]AMW32419.1 ABC transporter ATP-binding protein [Fervidobacterium islandicum]QAV34001.1 ABC transporter ATP-binding protein [Fervidobacterium changbaicum]SDH79634.1 ABC-2 type transport system ATP-binding protein [Fervidobacterium changbaicum]